MNHSLFNTGFPAIVQGYTSLSPMVFTRNSFQTQNTCNQKPFTMKTVFYIFPLLFLLWALPGRAQTSGPWADAGPDAVVCSSDYQLNAFSSPGDSGQWILLTPTASIVQASEPKTYIYNLQPGLNVLVWKVMRGQQAAFDTLYINNQMVTADAGMYIETCGPNATLSGSHSLNAAAASWSSSSGTVTFSDPSNMKSQVTNLPVGTTEFTLTVSNAHCQTKSMVQVSNRMPSANAGTDMVVCQGSVMLNAASPHVGNGYWNMMQGDGYVDDPDSTNANLMLYAPGRTVLEWTVENYGCRAVDQLIIDYNPVEVFLPDQITSCEPTFTLHGNVNPANATLNWEVLGGGVQIVSTSGATANLSNLSQGLNAVQLMATKDGCTNDKVAIINYNPVFVNAGPDHSVCQNSDSLFASIPANGTGWWTVVEGAGTILNPSLATTPVLGLSEGHNIFRWTVRGDICQWSDEIDIVYNPMMADTVLEQKNVCGDFIYLSGMLPAGATGFWQVIRGEAVLENAADPNAKAFELGQFENHFRWTVQLNGCMASVEEIVKGNLGTAANINAGTDITNACGNATLAATGSGTWSVVLGSATIVSPTNPNSQVTNLSPGQNIFRWSNTQSGCYVSDDVSVFNDKGIANAGIDKTVCDGKVYLQANAPLAGFTGAWSVVEGAATFQNANMPATQATGLNLGSNVFRWNISKGGCTASDDVMITNLALTADAGDNDTVCTSEATLSAATAPAGSSYDWTTILGNGVLSDPRSKNPSVTALSPGVNRFRLTITHPSGCISTDETEVYNGLVTAQGHADIEVCSSEVWLNATPLTGGIGIWQVMTGGGNIQSPSSYTTQVTDLPPGANIFRWIVFNGGCSDEYHILVTSNQVTANAGPDQTVCSTTATLGAANPAPYTGYWMSYGSAMIANPTNHTTSVTGLYFGANTFRWVVENGSCMAEDEVVITVREPDAMIQRVDINTDTRKGTLYALAPNGSGTWSIDPPTAVLSTPNQAVCQVSNLPTSGAVTIVWTVNSGTCIGKDTIRLIDNEMQFATLANAAVCTTEVNLGTTSFPTQNYGVDGWTVLAGNAMVSPANSLNPMAMNLSPGENLFRLHIYRTDNRVHLYNDMKVTSDVLPPVVFTPIAIAGTSTTLTAPDPAPATGMWSLVSGDGTIVAPNNYSTMVNSLLMGPNIFKWTRTLNGCSSFSTVEVTRKTSCTPPGGGVNAGSDNVICSDFVTLAANNPGAGYTGMWYVINGSGTFAGMSNAMTTVSDLAPGVNTFRWLVTQTATGCTFSDDVVITNNMPTPAQTGLDMEICGNSVTLAANKPQAGETGAWTIISGTATISNANSPITNVTNLTPDLTKLRWTITKNACVSFDDISITSNQVYANAGTDAVICGDDYTLLANNPALGATGYWMSTGGEVVIDNCTSYNATAHNLMPGANRLQWQVTKGGCMATDEIIITNNQVNANAGPDMVVCDDKATLSALLPAGASGAWSTIAGSAAVLVNSVQPNTVATNLPSGINRFVWSVSQAGCTGKDTVRITSDKVTAVAGADQVVCGTTATLTASNPLTGTGYWSVVIGNGIIANSISSTTTVTGLAPGSNVFRWVVMNGSCYAGDEVVVTNRSIQINKPMADKVVCEDYVKLVGDDPQGNPVSWKLNGTQLSNTTRELNYIGLQNGPNTFQYIIGSGTCTKTDEVVITYKQLTANAGPDQVFCRDNTKLIANNPLQGTGAWSLEAGTGTIDVMSLPITFVRNLGYGANTFRWSVSKDGCTRFDEVVIRNNTVVADYEYINTGLNYTFTDKSIGKKSAVDWNFGDGTVSKLPVASKSFAKDGLYKVCLTVYSEGTTCLDTKCEDITVGNVPCVADFTTTVVAETRTVTVNNASIGTTVSNTKYLWDFGDGTTDTKKDPVLPHVYANPGVYKITLSINDDTKACRSTVTKEVAVGQGRLLADFNYFVNDSVISLLDRSQGDVNKWYWTFGNGAFSHDKDPVYKYPKPGNYEVCLQVFDSTSALNTTANVARICKPVVIGDLNDCRLMAEFDFFVDNPTKTISLTDRTLGTGYDIFWLLGDGATSTKPTVKHTYDEPGRYDVELVVKQPGTACVSRARKVMFVGQAACEANFDYVVGADSLYVKLVNTSIGTFSRLYWKFDDGGSSFDANPEYFFSSAGLHAVTLVVEGNTCFDQETKLVQVGKADCQVKFEAFADSLTNTVYFTSYVGGESTPKYFWEFGDGASSTLANPAHEYTKPGYQRVALTIKNEESGCKARYEDVVLIGDQYIDCEADFFYMNDNAKTNTLRFYDASKGDIVSYVWYFGDRSPVVTGYNPDHTFSKPGHYLTCLTVLNTSNISHTKCKEVTVENNGLEDNACFAKFVYFVDSLNKSVTCTDLSFGNPNQWNWMFEEDKPLVNTRNPVYTFAARGYYLISEKIVNTLNNCTSQAYAMISVGAVNQGLVCGFGYAEDESATKASGYPVDFLGAAFGNPAKVSWDFGDGTTDTVSISPTHYYSAPGVYTACLTVTDEVTGEEDQSCQTITVGGGFENVDEVLLSDNDGVAVFPNPFRQSATITYNLANEGHFELSLHDISGQKVQTIIESYAAAGTYRYMWESGSLAKGLYFLHLQTDKELIISKVIRIE